MNLRVLFLIFCLSICTVSAEPAATPAPPKPAPSVMTPQNIPFENCTKMFEGVNKEKLFYLTLGAISANRFTVEEIQSYNGYIIFTAAKQKYLATVAEIDGSNSILKITPCNDIYFFRPAILTNMFKYIELNKSMEIK